MKICNLTIYNDNPLLIRLYTPNLITELDLLPNLRGFHKRFATGVACRQGALTPVTWSCPILDLHLFYLLRPLTPYTGINKTLYQFVTLMPNLAFLLYLTFYQILVSTEHLRRVWHADRGRLLLRTPGPVLLGTFICSSCSDQSFSRTCRCFSALCTSNIPRNTLDIACTYI